MTKPTSPSELRDAILSLGFGSPDVIAVQGSDNRYILRLEQISSVPKAQLEKARQGLAKEVGGEANITDFRLTPVPRVHASVEALARQHGTSIAEGELIGLIPQDAYDADAAWIRQMSEFDPDQKILERKLQHPLAWPEA